MTQATRNKLQKMAYYMGTRPLTASNSAKLLECANSVLEDVISRGSEDTAESLAITMYRMEQLCIVLELLEAV